MAPRLSSIVSCGHWAFPVITMLALTYLGYQYQLFHHLAEILPAPRTIFTDIVKDMVVFILTVVFSLLGLKGGSSAQVVDALRHCLSTLKVPIGISKTGSAGKTSRIQYAVRSPCLNDVAGLQQLYNDDYVKAHVQMHPSARGASTSDWEEALGPVDFEAVICEQTKGSGDVRLLKCVEAVDSVAPEDQPPLGYILYEFRAKGSPGKKPQRYCEVVNVIVGKQQQGCGLGRLLFQEMEANIEQSGKPYKGDLRLFVAKANVRPLEWYRRLGFKDAGWQTERLGQAEVPFLRMTRKTM